MYGHCQNKITLWPLSEQIAVLPLLEQSLIYNYGSNEITCFILHDYLYELSLCVFHVQAESLIGIIYSFSDNFSIMARFIF